MANVIQAQDVEPKNVIENFFNGFHKKDTLALRATTHKDIVMQSVATTKEGNKVTYELEKGMKGMNAVRIKKI